MRFALFLFLTLTLPTLVRAQDEVRVREVVRLDSLFWTAYNTCDTARFRTFLAPDLEFFHDKGGITLGIEAMMRSFSRNICGNPDARIRREAVQGREQVFPMRSDAGLYGVLITGEHRFYVTPKGQSERLETLARFSDFWMEQNGQWKLARVFSYDHRPAPYENTRKVLGLSSSALNRCTGIYVGKGVGEIHVQRQENHLLASIGPNRYVLYPSSPSLFFLKERDLIFEFEPAKGKPLRLIVREFGAVVEEAARKAE